MDCIHQDEQGLCRPGTIAVNSDGTPITQYGERYTRDGETEIKGWGAHDGTRQLWASPTNHSYVIV
jgi:hypothetical protein